MALQPCPVHLAALRHGPAAGLAHGRFFTAIHAHPTRIPIRFVAISGENPSKHVTRPTNDAVLGVPNGAGARRAWLSFGDVGFSGLLVSGSFSGLLVFLAWLWCGCLFFWFFLLGLSFCVFLCPGFVGSGFFGPAGFCLAWFRVPGGRGTPGAWFRRGSYPVPVRGF
ncbi:hypothetical protein HMPREF9003_0360 [Bifidobacterium dentium JCVIHMP022]|uniref:Uncharacterized protein n=1 Tax=Bifidobacterium dentium JCVIHMP022 TaxID=553191 RepID=A0AB72Z5I5_9BIFI|nr:hypothetical protein HMPREF9003_0360 [Bifidobacterium dentium JCVIHMP022]